MHDSDRSRAGFGLTEALIAGTIGIALMIAIAKMATSNLQSARKLDSSADRSTLVINIANGVDCATTLPAPVSCPAGNSVALRARDGTEIVAAGGSQYGKWTVLARCATNGIDVRAAALTAAAKGNPAALAFNASNPAWFARDEVQKNLLYSWSHPKAALFPTGAGGLCSHLFSSGGTTFTECGPNEYVAGINFANRALECKPIPSCPINEALSWTGSGFTCVAARTDAYITSKLIQPEITNNNDVISSTPFTCVTGTRQGGGALSGGGTAMSAYDSGSDWGMVCNSPFSKVGCTIGNTGSADGNSTGSPATYADWDIWPLNNGCMSDNEEKATNAKLTLTCCRSGDLP